jgi:beta-glucanase (GH16 family)
MIAAAPLIPAAAALSVLLLATLIVGAGVEKAADPAPNVGGAARPVVWHDEFAGRRGTRPDPRKWSFETGHGWGDRELQSYTSLPRNASLDGRGHLVITARREAYNGADQRPADYTSARINSQAKFEFAYGHVDARIRVPTGRGLHPAFWALGSNLDTAGWPTAGEIDLMEVFGDDPFTVHGTLHGPRSDGGEYKVKATRRKRARLSTGFHVYGMSWRPGRIAFRLDGEVYAVRTPSDLPSGARWRFDRPFFLLLNVAVGPRWLGAPNATTRWPARMLVDWVRVRGSRATFCPTVRAPELRNSCPRRRPPATPEAWR